MHFNNSDFWHMVQQLSWVGWGNISQLLLKLTEEKVDRRRRGSIWPPIDLHNVEVNRGIAQDRKMARKAYIINSQTHANMDYL